MTGPIEYVPRPYQEPQHRHLQSGPRKLLAAGCGAGKTVVTGTHMLDRFDVRRWLVVAPKAVAQDTWAREFAKWKHLCHVKPRLLGPEDFGMARGVELDGKRYDPTKLTPEQLARAHQSGLIFSDRKETKKLIRSSTDLVSVISYDWWPWIVKATGVNFPFQGIVFDEQTFLKNHTSERFKAAKHACWKLGIVTDVVELGGTPIPRGYEELWAPLYLLDKGETMGATLTEWRDNWCEADQRGRDRVYTWKVRESKLPELQERLKIPMAAVDVDLGIDVIHSDHLVTLPPAARKAYEEIEELYLSVIQGGAVTAVNEAVVLAKLLQICNGSVYDETRVLRRVHDAKLDAVVEAVQAASTPVMLAYPFRADWKLLSARLGASVGHIKVPGDLEKFRRGRLKGLAGHPASFSHGIDGCQDVANTVYWFGATHNLEWYIQLYKRLHRLGQKAQTVFVRRFIAADTREERILHDVLEGRDARQKNLLKVLDVIAEKESE